MEEYFKKFRNNIIEVDLKYRSPYGEMPVIYADWIVSGRMYRLIEDWISDVFGPFTANTHSEASETGTCMTLSYRMAHKKIKAHVNASSTDVIITTGTGMTAAIVKFQRILGFKRCGRKGSPGCLQGNDQPVVFVSHMEHHSNHTSWFETMAEVVQLEPNEDNLVDLEDLRKKLEKYKDRSLKIGSFTACSNVTGIETPYRQMARLMHEHGGICFVDFAASAPYTDIDMHPEDPLEKLDAIFFSPHKFLGGPGSAGVLVFDSVLYPNFSPDTPGGGTVWWTNRWGEYHYIDDIEVREDGGTPGFLQAIRIALAIELKQKMGTPNIKLREQEITARTFNVLESVPGLSILADKTQHRLPVFSFYIEPIHYNLIVKLLSDRFGIQARGGCACAGTYGHILLDVSYQRSAEIFERIHSGDFSLKPGWVRISLHPTTTNEEIDRIGDALKEIVKNYEEWGQDYIYDRNNNEFRHKSFVKGDFGAIAPWFELD